MTKKKITPHRKSIDLLVSWTGLLAAVALLAVSVGLFWANSFIGSQIEEQLSSQKITFPATGSEAYKSLPASDQQAIEPFAGETVTTGQQARVFADNYIAVHLSNIGGGKTYSELSAQSQSNPDDKKLAGQVDTIFRGETLRGILLNAYAFGTMAMVAQYAAALSLVLAVVLAILAGLGFRHAHK
ncbi:MAG: hypothetical protein L0H38_02855 [bacterium]|nr:hypothetical protein [bacterium]